MSFNLLDSAKGLITNELVSKASSYLGESESNVSKAIGGILPSLIGGLTEKVASTEGASTISKLAVEAHNSGLVNNLGGFFSNDTNKSSLGNMTGILSSLFGENKFSMLTNVLSNFSGVKSSSANSLISMAGSAILGLLGKHFVSNNMNSSGLASLLSSQKGSLLKAMPAGLNLSNVFSGFNTNASDDVKYISKKVSKTGKSGTSWFLPLLLLGAALLAFWYFFGKGCNSNNTTITDVTDSLKSKTEQIGSDIKSAISGKLDSLSGEWLYDAGDTVSIVLPNNAGVLSVGENSTENKLYQFLSNTDASLDTVKGNWFEFTNVHFKTGGSQVDSASMVQLTNMAAIAKAFPTAQFKLGGYTDNTGDSAANVVLSKKRAEAVVVLLKKLGASSNSVIGAEGYGPQWPLADNATAEGRAQNRRVAVNVKAK